MGTQRRTSEPRQTYEGVSSWAAPFVTEPDAQAQNVTPTRQRLGAWFEERQAAAFARKQRCARAAGTYAFRACACFIISRLGFPMSVTALAFVCAVGFGLVALLNLEEANIAGLELQIDPRELLDN